MPTPRPTIAALALSLALAGCVGAKPPTATDAEGPSKPRLTSSTASPTPAPAATSTPATGPTPTPAASDDGFQVKDVPRLSGTVKLPAAIVTASKTLTGRKVRLVDAQGAPVKDAQGKLLAGTIDADGRFDILEPLTGHTWVVEIVLPPEVGAARAFVTKDAFDKPVSVDLASTYATSYVLTTYVKDAKDPQATLDKLTASLAGELYAKATAAAGPEPKAPSNMLVATAADQLDKLRFGDAALARQLDAVRDVLSAATAVVGTGQPAIEVPLGWITDPMPQADGGFSFLDSDAGRVWRASPDGKLVDAFDGRAGEPIRAITRDAEGRVIVLTKERAMLLPADPAGKAQELFPADDARALLRDGQNRSYLLSQDDPYAAPRIWAVGALRTQSRALDMPPSTRFAGAAREATGRLLLLAVGNAATDKSYLLALDPVEAKATSLRELPAEWARARLGTDGRLYLLDEARHLKVWAPEAPAPEDRGVLDVGRTSGLDDVGAGPDGTFYFAFGYGVAGRVVRLDATGKTTFVAGAPPGAAAAPAAGQPAFERPTGLAIGRDGRWYVGDPPRGRVYAVDARGTVTPIAGSGRSGDALKPESLDGKPALEADLHLPDRVRLDAQGRLWIMNASPAGTSASGPVGSGQVLTLEADGTLKQRYEAPVGMHVLDFLPTSAGLLVVLRAEDKQEWTLVAAAPDGTSRPLAVTLGRIILGEGPRGRRVVVLDDQLASLAEDFSIRAITRDPALKVSDAVTVDQRGRVIYDVEGPDRIVRLDPLTKAITVLAGPGSSNYAATEGPDALADVAWPGFAPNGDMLFADPGNAQVRRVAADQLP